MTVTGTDYWDGRIWIDLPLDRSSEAKEVYQTADGALLVESGKIDNHMDVSQLVQQKLTELGLEQRDLAAAAEVSQRFLTVERLADQFPQQHSDQTKHRHETDNPQAPFEPKFVLGFVLLYPSLPNGFRELCALVGLNHQSTFIVRLLAAIVAKLPEDGCAIVHSVLV